MNCIGCNAEVSGKVALCDGCKAYLCSDKSKIVEELIDFIKGKCCDYDMVLACPDSLYCEDCPIGGSKEKYIAELKKLSNTK